MLTVLFFISAFSSLVWLIYAGLFVYTRFQTVDMTSVDAYTLALYAGLVVIPVWIVWQVFGFVNQYFKTKSSDKKLEQLYTQMKKNQDYTDLVVRVMLDAEHEIKDGFVVGKFDVFVADMNEILADIAQRSNTASSVKLGELWGRVKNGERWIIAKTFIENAKNQADFESYLKDKAQRDSVFKGTLLEFCARYQNLTNMLEKHDRDRIFITILQTGVMGKVYAMLAPIAMNITEVKEEEPLITEEEPTFEIAPAIEKMEAPKDEKPVSVFAKINPFASRKKKNKIEEYEQKETIDDDEAFFATLQKKMTEEENAPTENAPSELRYNEDSNEPHFEINVPSGEDSVLLEEESAEEYQQKSLDAFLNAPSVHENQEEKSEETDNLAYPFGGWVADDEKA